MDNTLSDYDLIDRIKKERQNEIHKLRSENTKQIFVESIWRCEECFNTHSEFLPHPESLLHEIKLEGRQK